MLILFGQRFQDAAEKENEAGEDNHFSQNLRVGNFLSDPAKFALREPNSSKFMDSGNIVLHSH